MLADMSAAEYFDWLDEMGARPDDSTLRNFEHATLCALLINLHGNPKEPAKPSDFIFGSAASRREQSEQEIETICASIPGVITYGNPAIRTNDQVIGGFGDL